jgi:pimeloyl-ACP methyl ester carboxylesterase
MRNIYQIIKAMRHPVLSAAVLVAMLAGSLVVLLGPGARAVRAQGHEGDGALPPIMIAKMGSFFAGGTVITAPGTFDPFNPTAAGQTLHADHVYVQFHIPPNARKLPLVMWHGCLSTAWESTPDDREGYQSIFVRRGWSVYIIDQPRQGRAGKSSVGITITPTPGDQASFNTFGLGIWPNFFPNTQFPRDPASLDHFLRQGGAGNGPADQIVSRDAVVALLDRIGPAVLVTHSAGGPLGWLTALKSLSVKGIVSYEPAQFVFPDDEALPPTPSALVSLSPNLSVPHAEFDNLTKIPIQIVWGGYIPMSQSPYPGPERMRLRMQVTGRQFADAVNRRGGDVTILHLPDVGAYGNTHFAFSDLNNVQIADLMSKYLHEKGLDKRGENE